MMRISVAESSRRRARNGRRSVEAAASTADASTAPLAAPGGSTADKGQDGVEAACARSRGGGVGCCWGAVVIVPVRKEKL